MLLIFVCVTFDSGVEMVWGSWGTDWSGFHMCRLCWLAVSDQVEAGCSWKAEVVLNVTWLSRVGQDLRIRNQGGSSAGSSWCPVWVTDNGTIILEYYSKLMHRNTVYLWIIQKSRSLRVNFKSNYKNYVLLVPFMFLRRHIYLEGKIRSCLIWELLGAAFLFPFICPDFCWEVEEATELVGHRICII